MKPFKSYKIIVPYTESAAPTKKFVIEYDVDAANRVEAQKIAEDRFNLYSGNTSASWVRIPDQSGIRIWRRFPTDPETPEFIDDLISSLPGKSNSETLSLLNRLGDLEDIFASSKIISLTKLDEPAIVASAIDTLGKIADPTSYFAVKNTYFQKSHPDIKRAVVKALPNMALPEDDVIGFYKIAIKDKATREVVFNLDFVDLLPLWLQEIENESEFNAVKENVLCNAEKSLMILVTLDVSDDKIFTYASRLVDTLEPIASENNLDDWPAAVKKYRA